MRIILHIDLDSFYASLEEQRKPELRGKAVVICMFSGRGESGAIATANYKARELGIKAGMPIVFAKRLGADAIFLPADLEYYRSESAKIMEIFQGYADNFQQVSIDEAYLDVSSCGSFEQAEEIAMKIKSDIRRMELTCSVGIAPNKLVAKMASRFKKPDGLTVVEEKEVRKFLNPMPVEKLHGIGGKTAEALGEMGIKTSEELAKADLKKLESVFGKNKAKLLKEKAEGVDDSPVTGQLAKQLSRIGTLKKDTADFTEIYGKIEQLAGEMHKKILKRKVLFRTVSIIIIGANLEMQTKSKTINETNKLEDILEIARALLREFLDESDNKVRRAGIRVSNLVYEEQKERKERSLQEFRIK